MCCSPWGSQRARHSWATEQQQKSIACMYHVFAVCLSVDEHLGCVYVLASVKGDSFALVAVGSLMLRSH